MLSFPYPANKLYDERYAVSKNLFFSTIPDCFVDFEDGHAKMCFSLRMVAARQYKIRRRKIAKLVLSKCSDEQIHDFTRWLTDNFSEDMQKEIFSLSVNQNGNIIPGKMLEKALTNTRKR